MRNIYLNRIDLVKKSIVNDKSAVFISKIKKLDWRGYHVESLKDGRKIIIIKPGGKTSKRKERHDFLVLIQSVDKRELWQISHSQLYDDLKNKLKKELKAARLILHALKKVYEGKEPNNILKRRKLETVTGQSAELILKTYKWIWAQEDINYPPPKNKGRAYSYEGWNYNYDKKKLERKRNGIIHLINKANKKWKEAKQKRR
jgi:hypothetical protein